MEPTNVGVILQGGGKVDFKLSPHAAKRKDIDTQIFRTWRKFFEDEVRGDAVPLFQHSKDSPAFLENISQLCEHTVTVTRPLAYQTKGDEGFNQVLNALYEQLVAPPEPSRGEQPVRPTSKYRELEEERNFQKRGVKKRPYLMLPGKGHWNAFRQVKDEDVIDKIEVGNILGLTADEIQKMAGVDPFISEFLKKDRNSSAPRRYWLIADRLIERFTDQTDEDFKIMSEELERVVETVQKRGGKVLRDAGEVQKFVEEIDIRLPPIDVALAP
jgi:hypothetical protein